MSSSIRESNMKVEVRKDGNQTRKSLDSDEEK